MIINDGDICSLVEVIQSEEGDTFVCYEPGCNPGSKAYEKWGTVMVEKFMGAIVVVDSQHPSVKKGKCLELLGITMKSKWKKLHNYRKQ